MNKTVKKVFMLLALLVGIFLAWQLVFNDNGIIVTAYNAMAKGLNQQYEKVAGSGQKLIPEWGDSDTKGSNGAAFDMSSDGK